MIISKSSLDSFLAKVLTADFTIFSHNFFYSNNVSLIRVVKKIITFM